MNESDKLLIELVENAIDVTKFKKKSSLSEADRTEILQAVKSLKDIQEVPMKTMKEQILKVLGYGGRVSPNVYLTRDEVKFVFNSIVLKK